MDTDCEYCYNGHTPEYFDVLIPTVTNNNCVYCESDFSGQTFRLANGDLGGGGDLSCTWAHAFTNDMSNCASNLNLIITETTIYLYYAMGDWGQILWSGSHDNAYCDAYSNKALTYDAGSSTNDCYASGTTAYITAV